MIHREFGKRLLFAAILSAGLYACFGGAEDAPGDVSAYDGIAEDEKITALGTEPFWSATISGNEMTYSTPDNIDGVAIEVSRFSGNGGLGFNGNLEGAPLQMAVTPGECSDQMSDRTYPFTVTLKIGEADLAGCGYTDQQPFSGEQTP